MIHLKPWRHHHNRSRLPGQNAATNPEFRRTKRCIGCRRIRPISEYATPNSKRCADCVKEREEQERFRPTKTEKERQRIAYMAATAPLRHTPQIGRDGGWYGQHFD